MISLAIGQLAEILNGQLIGEPTAAACTGVSIDSRAISQDNVFVAIAGENFDGHDFAAKAVENGAVCIIVEREVDIPDNRVVQVIVEDTILALGQLAAWYRQQLSAKVIAITGSVGKTTTRQILCQVLSSQFRCRQAIKSFNNHIGVPLTILSADTEDEFLLLELGSNHPGEIKYLTEIVRPDAALITLIGPAHLEGFGTEQTILVEKASIAEGLSPQGCLYVNGNQPELVHYVKDKYGVSIMTFGTSQDCDIVGRDFASTPEGGSLIIEDKEVRVPLAGTGNLMNTLGAWAICRNTGMGMSSFAQALEQMSGVEKRLEIRKIGSLTILDDCYNANPASMANALDFLCGMDTRGKSRKVFIAGTMHELGEESARYHRELGKLAAEQGVDILLTCGTMASEITMGAERCGSPNLIMQAYADSSDLCDNVDKWIQDDDIILVKGSRAEQLERIIDRLEEL